MLDKPLRAGIIGLGVGGAHARGYLRSPHTELVALCDSDPERLAARAAEYKIPPEQCFSDYRAMLSAAQLDVVSVCVPNALHAEVSLAALEAGAHVLCEKPLAISLEEALAMQRAAQSAQRRLMVAYNHRYRADVGWLRRVISEGALGEVYNVYAWWRREAGIPRSSWFSQKALSGGGALIDIGVHMLDLALWLLDFPRVETVSGQVGTHFGARGVKASSSPLWKGEFSPQRFDVDDSAFGFLRCAGGLSVHLHASWAEHRAPHEDILHLELNGTQATAVMHVVNYVQEGTLQVYTELGGQSVVITPEVRSSGIYGHEALIVESMAALVAGQPPPADVQHGVIGVQVVEALYRSSQTRREVVLE